VRTFDEYCRPKASRYPLDRLGVWQSSAIGAHSIMIDLTYPAIRTLCHKYLDPKRSESASFLIWYLENYYRLDELEAVD
jgi:hypothetical protein